MSLSQTIAAIGVSTSSLDALRKLLRTLPADTGAAVLVVCAADVEIDASLLREFARSCSVPVDLAIDNLRLRADHVYIAPNGVTRMEGGVLRCAAATELCPFDGFLCSVAAYGPALTIAIALAGLGEDGAVGFEHVKAAGGVAIAQAGNAAGEILHYREGLRSAADCVFSVDAIAAELARIARHPSFHARTERSGDETADIQEVMSLVLEDQGVDLGIFSERRVQRILARRAVLSASESVAVYVRRLGADRGELAALYRDIVASPEQPFRDAAASELLARSVLPELLAAKDAAEPIRIWVPGCSTGSAAYSIAMILLELLPDGTRRTFRVFATDLPHTTTLAKARAGRYPASISQLIDRTRLRRFFHEVDDGYEVSRVLRACVLFAHHETCRDPPFPRIDLIYCPRLLAELDPRCHERVLQRFHYALGGKGRLLLAADSPPLGVELFDREAGSLYRSSAAPSRRYRHYRDPGASDAALGQRREIARDEASTTELLRAADRVGAGAYLPPGVLIDENYEILQFRGRTSPFLSPPQGLPSVNLFAMARDGLHAPIRSAVEECRRTGVPATRGSVRVRSDGLDYVTEIRVLPVRLDDLGPVGRIGHVCSLVLFDEVTRAAAPAARAGAGVDGPDDSGRLREELTAVRAFLQSLIEKQQTISSDLATANDEMLAGNEELQSVIEELQTTRQSLEADNGALSTRNEQLECTVRDLGENSRRRTDFLAVLAHELRNPLAPIVTALTTLEKGIDEEDARALRAVISRQLGQLTRLVEDLVDAARIERGKIELRMAPIDLVVVAAAAVQAARPACEVKGVALAAQLPSEPVMIQGDKSRLSQALDNLLGNACKFTDAGGHISVILMQDRREAVLRIRDDGMGIASDQLARVFELFAQVDSSVERSNAGLGIGLALVKQMVERHGGRVLARSAGLGHGSEFELRLPLLVSEPDGGRKARRRSSRSVDRDMAATSQDSTRES